MARMGAWGGRPPEPAPPPAGGPGEAPFWPWHWPVFGNLVQAQVFHAAGDAAVTVALANTLFFSVPLGEARDKVGLYLLLTMAPFALLSPVVGPLLDRWRNSYRAAIVGAAGARLVLALLLAGRTDRLTLYPLAFGLLVLSRAHGVSRSALVPEVLPQGRSLIWANAWLSVVSVLAGAAGAGVAAGLNALDGPRLALWAAAGLFAAAVVPALRLPRPRHEERRDHVADFRSLLTARLISAGVAMAAARAALGFAVFLFAFVMRSEGHGARGLAVAVAAGAVGGFAGSAVAPLLRAVLRERLLLVSALLASAVAALWAALSFDVTRAAVVAGIVGFGAAAGRLAFDSILQHDAPDSVRGRTFARYETIFQLWWVGGGTLATVVPFNPATGLEALAVICLGGVALSTWGLAGPSRRRPGR